MNNSKGLINFSFYILLSVIVAWKTDSYETFVGALFCFALFELIQIRYHIQKMGDK